MVTHYNLNITPGGKMIRIERASLEDADIIKDINTMAFNDEMNRVLGRDGGPPGYNTKEEHEKLIKDFIVYKVFKNEVIIGSFFLINHTSEHYSLESFCIYPEYQNKGYGYETLKVMEETHPEVKKWTLESMKGSDRIQHLYEKFGYKMIAEEEWFYSYEKLV